MHDTAIGRPVVRTSALAPPLVPRASFPDTLGTLAEVFLPTIGKGVIIRRPAMVALAERLDLDRRAVRRMQRLRRKYGSGPLLIRLPWRSLAVILDPAHVDRVLGESPEPFATETRKSGRPWPISNRKMYSYPEELSEPTGASLTKGRSTRIVPCMRWPKAFFRWSVRKRRICAAGYGTGEN